MGNSESTAWLTGSPPGRRGKDWWPVKFPPAFGSVTDLNGHFQRLCFGAPFVARGEAMGSNLETVT